VQNARHQPGRFLLQLLNGFGASRLAGWPARVIWIKGMVFSCSSHSGIIPPGLLRYNPANKLQFVA